MNMSADVVPDYLRLLNRVVWPGCTHLKLSGLIREADRESRPQRGRKAKWWKIVPPGER
ncbi:hypothetical protein GI374_11565 [Paracoccus sp. S-4012]|uniref:hypothetical protein n=1 Tax=Paracoccus sp. S-4012 TaxID=2665648 RepID=UPI0012AFBBE8|nr:hypothetical protein [Paracoccus sp. S-4012]MRX51074.1 hypothetical protein [Paracoccus sp. S-4012]